MGARNEYGYQVRPAAWGARYARSSYRSSWANPRMSSADAPRPWTRMIVKRASTGLGPLVSTGRPTCGSIGLTADGILARDLGSRCRQRQRWQYALERRPLPLVLLRQHQLLAEVVRRLVDRKSRRISGDLEQHTARLSIVNRVEVVPIDDGRDVVADSGQLAAPLQLLGVVRRAPRNVM